MNTKNKVSKTRRLPLAVQEKSNSSLKNTAKLSFISPVSSFSHTFGCTYPRHNRHTS